MNNFEQSKFNITAFIQQLISGRVIVSYGFITDVNPDFVTVTAAVSASVTPSKIKCVYMNLGNELFSVNSEPEIGTRVLVLSPDKAAEGMYESYEQILENEGRSFILTGAMSSYSSQFAMCIPIMEASSVAVNRLMVNDELLSLILSTEVSASIDNNIEIDTFGDSSIELHEGTEHFRGCYGNMEETFGMVEGIGGAEKEGDFVYKDTYGKFSSVEKNYESGLKVTVGKAYEKPFLTDKGALLDSSAPVTMEFGTGAPVTLQHGAPLTLAFGEGVMTITLDEENGLDIALTGSTKVNISAATGKFNISNSTGSLKAILDKVADLFTNMTTIGPNVVSGAPYTAGATPATAALATELRTLVAGLLE